MRILTVVALLAVSFIPAPAAAVLPLSGVELPAAQPMAQADLKDELEAGLKARRPQEFQFIAKVVDMVNRKQLPLEMVRSTFIWARKKKPYPYPFFERALIQRAAKIGVRIN